MAHVNPEPVPAPAGQPITIWTKSFGLSLLERFISTVIQILIGFGTAFLANGSTFEGWDWQNTLIGLAVSAGLVLLKGILANVVTKDGPSFTHAEQVVPPLPNVSAS